MGREVGRRTPRLENQTVEVRSLHPRRRRELTGKGLVFAAIVSLVLWASRSGPLRHFLMAQDGGR